MGTLTSTINHGAIKCKNQNILRFEPSTDSYYVDRTAAGRSDFAPDEFPSVATVARAGGMPLTWEVRVKAIIKYDLSYL